jgi:hypothetical protein
MISRPKAIPAGIPAGDPPIGSGSKCDAVGHCALPSSRLLRFVQNLNTDPSQTSASNPIETEKRHSVRVSCGGPRAGGGRRTGHDRPTPSRSGARLQPLLYTGQPGAKRRKQVLSDPRSARRIGRLRPSISTPFAQQPGTPEPPGTPPQPPPDPTAPPPYEDPPRPIPIPRPDEPPVVDDPPPRRNA